MKNNRFYMISWYMMLYGALLLIPNPNNTNDAIYWQFIFYKGLPDWRMQISETKMNQWELALNINSF